MEDDTDKPDGTRPESLLPYDTWTEEALRHVVVLAVSHATEQGLPGAHHYYITFRTRAPGVAIPNRLLTQYPDEMTIVLQHQFWDLSVDDAGEQFSVGLSFGGIPTTLTVPFSAVTAFADPSVQFGLRFTPDLEAETEAAAAPPAPALPAPAVEAPEDSPQVVSLDAFRRRGTPKE